MTENHSEVPATSQNFGTRSQKQAPLRWEEPPIIITVRNKVAKVIFYRFVSVHGGRGACSGGGAWSRGSVPGGGGCLVLGGSALRGGWWWSAPGDACSRGGDWYPRMHWGRFPQERRLLLRTVRILLQCILVNISFRLKKVFILLKKLFGSVAVIHALPFVCWPLLCIASDHSSFGLKRLTKQSCFCYFVVD